MLHRAQDQRAGRLDAADDLDDDVGAGDQLRRRRSVNSAGSTPRSARSRPARRTAMPTSSSGAPTRAARSSACSVSSRATAEPTTPQPEQRDAQRLRRGHSRRSSTACESLPSVRVAGRSLFRDPDIARTPDRTVIDVEGEQVVDRSRGARSPGPRRPRTATTGGRGAWLYWLAMLTGSRRRCPGRRAGRPARRRRAGTRRARRCRRSRSACPTTRASTGGAVERAAGQRARVVGVVERGADVVAHPAVDRDVGAGGAAVELDVLDRADLVEREGARARRSPGRARPRSAARRRRAARALAARRSRPCPAARSSGAQRVVLGGVGDAEAAAEVELGQLDAVLVARSAACRPTHAAGGDLEAGGVEDLRADVAVQPAQVERRAAPATAPHRLGGLRRRRGEKPNFWSSCAVAMNSWVCASTPTVTRTSTGATTPSSAATAGDAVDLVEGVDDDPARRRASSAARDLGVATCCCRASRSAPPGRRRAARRRARRRCRRRGCRPSSATQRATAVQRNALPA